MIHHTTQEGIHVDPFTVNARNLRKDALAAKDAGIASANGPTVILYLVVLHANSDHAPVSSTTKLIAVLTIQRVIKHQPIFRLKTHLL